MSILAAKGKVGRIIGLHRRKFGQAAACFSGKEQRQQCLVIPRRKVFKAVDFTMRISLSHSIPAYHTCLQEISDIRFHIFRVFPPIFRHCRYTKMNVNIFMHFFPRKTSDNGFTNPMKGDMILRTKFVIL